MNKNQLEPRKALNPAFLKIKPNRTQIEVFKTNLIQLLDNCNDKEREEHHKNLVIDFLKKTYYDPTYFVNTKGSNDLVIHNGSSAKSNVGVIIEAKSTSNKTEMISVSNLNGKALQELVLYFLRERITENNLEIKHLVVTNIYEWFVFDSQVFDKLFAQNKKLVKDFQEFEAKQLSGVKTDFFYKEIAKPFIEKIQTEIQFTYFDFRNYDKALRNNDKEDDKSLIALYKLLSPEHLLKLSFANDNNTLDKNFYNELLHIIGLNEVKDRGKKVIGRHKLENRSEGSLLENTILQLESLDKISRLENVKQYGETREEQLFNIALELCITWVNRILFLKLLEAQLITYHKSNKSYSFLNVALIPDYDILNKLFFQVLAKKVTERTDKVAQDFAKVPYLNSSLFEPTDLEHKTLIISNLENNLNLPLLNATVIKNNQGKKVAGTKNALDYFFSFLDSYDFAGEGSEDIQEDNKTLINASVLGLIFEKINGYKDGSFFTPSFITMYMCKETIRRAVVQKFNEVKHWNCEIFDDLKNKDFTIAEANKIVNAIKICDPAVGSGHFLVSALNEIIAIKHELQILADDKFIRLKNYNFQVVNDELIVTDEIGKPFVYFPKNSESQRIQESLFHEKQTIIENCLFGVDINPNSVKICRLRLWIELLKNAYYKNNGEELETLPNIDINIKCGNSLISRFALDADLKKALKQSKWNIESYKNAVATYQNAETKEQKREMESLIDDIKGNFETEIAVNDKRKIKLEKLKGELFNYTQQVGLFEYSKKEQAVWNKKVNRLTVEVKQLETELEDIKSNKIYQNAFEWRFEFPQVLDNDGDFIGFDVVIGNPPYIKERDAKAIFEPLRKAPQWKQYVEGKMDLWYFFLHLGFDINKQKGNISYITNSYWMKSDGSKNLINRIYNDKILNEIIYFDDYSIFEEVSGKHMIHSYINKKVEDYKVKIVITDNTIFDGNIYKEKIDFISNENIVTPNSINIKTTLSSMFDNCKTIDDFYETNIGIQESPDKLVQKNISEDFKNKFKPGEGVFVINKQELDNLNLTIDELKIIKPYLNSNHIEKYGINFNGEYLIFSDKINRNKIKDGFYPNIKKHLDRYAQFITSSNLPYGLHRDRSSIKNPFEQPKLICKGMFASPEFTYDDENYYTGFSFSIITEKNKKYSLKYLLALMNSRLGNYWFQINGKKRGIGVDIGVKVFRLFPVKELLLINQQPFIEKVNEILTLRKENPQADTSSLEKDIDVMVYALYGLSREEIDIVES